MSYQYKLRFPPLNDWEVPRQQRKNKGYLGGPYLCYFNGYWRLYRNRWKANWDRKHGTCACIAARTIPELIVLVRKSRDGRYL